MKKKNEYTIVFSGLKKGIHEFDYKIDTSFFEIFGYDEFDEVAVDVELKLNKKETLMELNFSHQGTVKVPCDVSNEMFDMPISGTLDLVVKFGEVYNDDSDELLILPHGAYELNVAQYIYEMIVLSVPFKRVHPSLADEYEDDDDENLVYVTGTEEEIEEVEEQKNDIDPRWEKLKNLLTDNN